MPCTKKVSIQELADAAMGANFPPDKVPTIVAIALAESGGGCVDAINRQSGARGVLQFMPFNKEGYDCYTDYRCQFKAAYKLSNGGKNFCPWASYADKNCPADGRDRINLYQQFLPHVNDALKNMTIRTIEGQIPILNPSEIPGSGALDAVGGDILSEVKSAVSPLGNIKDFLGNFATKTFWARIALFILGLFILWEAMKHLSGSGNTNVTVTLNKALTKAGETEA